MQFFSLNILLFIFFFLFFFFFFVKRANYPESLVKAPWTNILSSINVKTLVFNFDTTRGDSKNLLDIFFRTFSHRTRCSFLKFQGITADW